MTLPHSLTMVFEYMIGICMTARLLLLHATLITCRTLLAVRVSFITLLPIDLGMQPLQNTTEMPDDPV